MDKLKKVWATVWMPIYIKQLPPFSRAILASICLEDKKGIEFVIIFAVIKTLVVLAMYRLFKDNFSLETLKPLPDTVES